MTNRGTQPADTRAAQAALLRLSDPEIITDRSLLLDNTSEDMTVIVIVVRKRHQVVTAPSSVQS